MIRVGILTPHTTTGPEAELPEMAAGNVAVEIVRVSGFGSDPTPATELERAARTLSEAGDVRAIGCASTTSAYALGLDAESAIVSRLSRLTGLPVASTCAAAVSALRALDALRVALIGAHWFAAEHNEAATAYFREQGFEVVSSASAGLVPDPERIAPDAVHEWVSHHVADGAQAVFIGGNGFRAAAAIDRLERTLGRPVLTANQVLLWKLLADVDEPIPIDGYGQLFTRVMGRRTAPAGGFPGASA